RYLYPPKTGLTATEMLSYNYYDNYEVQTTLNTESYNPVPFQADLLPGGDVPAKRSSNYAFLTGSEVKLVKNPDVTTGLQDWTSSKIWYDYYGRSIYSVAQNATGAKDSAYTQYNQLGPPIFTLTKHNVNTAGGSLNTQQRTKNYYESYSGRLLSVSRKTNNADWEPVASYQYDEFGRSSREILGFNAETRLYTYNIRGEL